MLALEVVALLAMPQLQPLSAWVSTLVLLWFQFLQNTHLIIKSIVAQVVNCHIWTMDDIKWLPSSICQPIFGEQTSGWDPSLETFCQSVSLIRKLNFRKMLWWHLKIAGNRNDWHIVFFFLMCWFWLVFFFSCEWFEDFSGRVPGVTANKRKGWGQDSCLSTILGSRKVS